MISPSSSFASFSGKANLPAQGRGGGNLFIFKAPRFSRQGRAGMSGCHGKELPFLVSPVSSPAGRRGGATLRSKIVKETISKPSCHKPPDLLNRSHLVRLVGQGAGRSPKPFGFRKIFLLPENLPFPVPQGYVEDDNGLIFQDETGPIVRDGVEPKIVYHPLQQGVRLRPVRDVDPSIQDELPSECLGERNLDPGFVGAILESGDGDGTQSGGHMGFLPHHLVAAGWEGQHAKEQE